MGLRGPKPKRREVIWSPELAYAIGLITTDGSLSCDGRHLDFTSKDKEQIRALMKCLDIKKIKITKKYAGIARHGWAYRIQWGDIFFYHFLEQIGLTSNKSKKIAKINIPQKYFLDFLRGHFDGDGSFYSYFDPRWKSSFMFYLAFVTASKAHIIWIREELKKLLGVTGHITTSRGRFLFQLKYAKKESLLVMNAMYSTTCPIHLSRKRLKIERALRIVGESLLSGRKKSTK
ncbi:MAG: LAGLIDADG family homing endonuclease [Minisyncoccia bacterium]